MMLMIEIGVCIISASSRHRFQLRRRSLLDLSIVWSMETSLRLHDGLGKNAIEFRWKAVLFALSPQLPTWDHVGSHLSALLHEWGSAGRDFAVCRRYS